MPVLRGKKTMQIISTVFPSIFLKCHFRRTVARYNSILSILSLPYDLCCCNIPLFNFAHISWFAHFCNGHHGKHSDPCIWTKIRYYFMLAILQPNIIYKIMNFPMPTMELEGRDIEWQRKRHTHTHTQTLYKFTDVLLSYKGYGCDYGVAPWMAYFAYFALCAQCFRYIRSYRKFHLIKCIEFMCVTMWQCVRELNAYFLFSIIPTPDKQMHTVHLNTILNVQCFWFLCWVTKYPYYWNQTIQNY